MNNSIKDEIAELAACSLLLLVVTGFRVTAKIVGAIASHKTSK